VPTYPGPLPGIDNPDLIISLRRLSSSAIQIFLEVEYPGFNPIVVVGEKPVSTIGAFYNRILKEFESVDASGSLKIQEDPQIDMTSTGYFSKAYVVKNISHVKAAIGTIQLQGEGSASSPEEGSEDLAHYYRFAEIFEGQKLVLNKETKQWKFEGGPMPFPKVSPMAKVSTDGYLKEKVNAEIGENLEKFDRGFTQMMNQPQEAWTPDSETGKASPAALNKLIDTVRTLREFAKILINTPVVDKDTSGNYGPCFRIV
jgi:hypothetical protein